MPWTNAVLIPRPSGSFAARTHESADATHMLRLLGARRERRQRSGAPDQCEEFPTFHAIAPERAKT